MAGIEPLDIYRDSRGNVGTYVHLKKQSYLAADKAKINQSMILQEYAKQAVKLENSAMDFFEDGISKTELEEVVKLHKAAYKESFQDDLLQDIYKEFMNNFGGAQLSASRGLNGAEELEAIYNYLDNAINTMSEIDEVVFNYLQTKDGMKRHEGSLVALSQTQAAKARTSFQNLLRLKKKMSGKGIGMDPDKIRESIRANVSNVKGEMMEVISACAKQQALNSLNVGIKANSSVAGDLDVLIKEEYMELQTLSKKTQAKGSMTSKSDALTVHQEFNPQTGEIIRMGVIGESTKSYPVGTSKAVSTVSKTPWGNLFTLSDLANTNFEYIYANAFYHDTQKFTNPSSMVNRFLAARTATYAMAGIGDLSQGNPPALFLVGTNKAIYLPELFKDISNKKAKPLTMSVDKGEPEKNIRYEGKGTNESQAYIRNKKILSSLRNDIKFSGKWSN